MTSAGMLTAPKHRTRRAKTATIETAPASFDLRLGRYQDVMSDVGMVDAVISDPPYSATTHDGQAENRADISYAHWTAEDVVEYVRFWAPRCRGWIVSISDDVLGPVWRAEYRAAGRVDFMAVPILQHKPRQQGDGPGPGAVFAYVSRPVGAEWSQWGSLPGWYGPHAPEKDAPVLGAKPLAAMRPIVRDYSRPGDRVAEPCAGWGTTIQACRIEHRIPIAAERDPATHAAALARLSVGFTPDMFATLSPQPKERAS